MAVIINYILLMYQNGSDVPNTNAFNAVTNLEFNNVTRDQSTALSGRMYDHVLARRREWDVVISADELAGSGNEKLAWLEAFWNADKQFVRTDTTDTEVIEEMTFTRVMTGGGRSPKEFIRNNKLLPQYKMTLIEALR